MDAAQLFWEPRNSILRDSIYTFLFSHRTFSSWFCISFLKIILHVNNWKVSKYLSKIVVRMYNWKDFLQTSLQINNFRNIVDLWKLKVKFTEEKNTNKEKDLWGRKKFFFSELGRKKVMREEMLRKRKGRKRNKEFPINIFSLSSWFLGTLNIINWNQEG